MPHPSVGAVADIDVDKRLKKIQSDQSMNLLHAARGSDYLGIGGIE